MFFKISVADRIFEIRSLYNEIYILCENYIVKSGKSNFIVTVTQEDINKEAAAVMRSEYVAFPPQHLETTVVLRKLANVLSSLDTIVMHGSVIATDGEGYLITAPSGVGKSTRTKLWLESIPGSFVVNGDKPMVRVTDGRAYAYGTPWCGKEGWNRNTSIPLKAIFLLERADEEKENLVSEISLSEAYPFLLHQTYRPEDITAKKKTLRILQMIVEKVKIYRFRSEPTAEAVRLAWDYAKQC